MSDPGTVSSPRTVALVERLVALADTLVDDYDVAELLDGLVRSCVDLLDITGAGLVLADQRGTLEPVASSSEETRLLQLCQLQNDEGPGLDCFRSGAPVVEPDLTARAERWPRFSPAAVATGCRSVYAVPMRLREQVIGALTLFGADGSLSAEDQRIARALADVATIGILQQRSLHRAEVLAGQLQNALDTRIVIEQAKGVLAAHGGLDMDAAFEALRGHARNANLKLSRLADDVVHSRVPPDTIVPARQDPGGR